MVTITESITCHPFEVEDIKMNADAYDLKVRETWLAGGAVRLYLTGDAWAVHEVIHLATV